MFPMQFPDSFFFFFLYGNKAFDRSLSIKDSLSRVYLVIKKPLSDGSQSVQGQSLPGAMPQFLVLKAISKLWPVPQSCAHTQKSAQGGSALTLGHTPPSPASPACQMWLEPFLRSHGGKEEEKEGGRERSRRRQFVHVCVCAHAVIGRGWGGSCFLNLFLLSKSPSRTAFHKLSTYFSAQRT